MKRDAKSKLSASLLVLVLALSALVLIPAGNTGQAASGKSIYVPVLSGGLPVSNAFVNLTDVHTGAVTPARFTSSVSAYVVSDAVSGYYRIDVVAPNHLDALNAATFGYDGFSNLTVNPILLTAFPAKIRTWNVTVKAADTGQVLPGASVGFYNLAANEFVATVATNSQGVAIIQMFDTSSGQYALVGRLLGRETNITGVTVSSDNVTTMLLKPSTYVSAVVTGPTGTLAVNPVSYLINTDPSIPTVKRVLKSTLGVYFDSYPGTYTMVIDADGAAADVESVTVVASPLNLQRTLTAQTQRVERVNVTFGANFNSMTLDVATLWSYDDPYPGLFFNDLGSLRAQIDLVLGNGDGTLSPSEQTAFVTLVNGFGTQYVTTSNLLTVNQTVYQPSAAMTNFVLNLNSNVAVTDTSPVAYSYQDAYASHASLSVGVTPYSMNLTARINSANADFRYTVQLPAGYENVANLTTPSSPIKVLGYLTVTVDSNHIGTGSELVEMTIQKSVKPNPVAGLDTPPVAANAAVVKNATGVIKRYIAKEDAEVSFTANGTTDPNGNNLPLTFTWDFNDSTVPQTTTNRTIRHTYADAFAQKFITLTVTDVAGLSNTTLLNLTVDGLDPVPQITISKLAVVANTIKVNQSEVVFMNATYSYDDAAVAGDKAGVIDHVQWYFGDGNFTSRITNIQTNVTHSYQRAGNYNITLNVTDVVGHWKNTTMKVHVNDTSAPVVSFVVKNSTFGTTILENDTLFFDASDSKDNLDALSVMHFSWNFGDGSTPLNGTGLNNVTHKYTRIGSLTVSLKITDLANNTGSLAKQVTIQSGPRPNVIIDKIVFSPETASPFAPGNLTAGKTGTILINLTNRGDQIAQNVKITVYIVPEGGGPLEQIATAGASQMYNATTGSLVSSIEPGGKVQIRIPYSPSHQGTLTIRVNATSDNQLQMSTRLASGTDALHVKSSPLTTILLWVGVIVIIVAIPSLLYIRSRWSKREKKGPRRPERKEREPEGE